jgi:hypothetical protein
MKYPTFVSIGKLFLDLQSLIHVLLRMNHPVFENTGRWTISRKLVMLKYERRPTAEAVLYRRKHLLSVIETSLILL